MEKYVLNEIEVYEILKKYKINIPIYFYMKREEYNENDFIREAFKLPGDKVVVKMVSNVNLHKTDSGGVKIVNKSREELSKAFREISKIGEAISVVEFLEHIPSLGEEILVGVKYDNAFGYVLMIAPGGTYTERIIKSVKKDFLPEFLTCDSSDEEIIKFIENSWTLSYSLGKVRGLKKKIEVEEIFFTIKSIISLIADFERSQKYIEEFEVNPFIVTRGKLYAADGVLRFRKDKSFLRVIPDEKAIKSITTPNTIAFCGVSEKKFNMGRIILNNTIKSGFPKENMYIIKDGIDEIDGVKCYKDVKSVPKEIDMYVVAVPVESVVDVLNEAAESAKVNGVVLITGGVGEKSGSEDIKNEIENIIKKARDKNRSFVLNGGNCMGIVLNKAKVNTFFIPEYKMKPLVGKNPFMADTAFISQSGAFVISTLTKIPHIICDYTITVGNQQDITVVDYIDYFSKTDVKVILAYIEGFKTNDGKRLIEIAKNIHRNGKILVLYKAGRTSFGQKAVMGHTASVAGDYLVFEKLLSENSIICSDFDEFCDMAMLAPYIADYKIKSKRAFFISNAGFETTGMGDNIFNLEPFSGDSKLKEKILDILKKYKLDSIVDFKNPMDLTPMANDEAISEIINVIYDSSLYSVIFTSMVPLTPSMNTVKSDDSPDDLDKSFINKISNLIQKKDVFIPLSVASGSLYDPYVEYAISKGFVVFRSSDRMVKVIDKFLSIYKN